MRRLDTIVIGAAAADALMVSDHQGAPTIRLEDRSGFAIGRWGTP